MKCYNRDNTLFFLPPLTPNNAPNSGWPFTGKEVKYEIVVSYWTTSENPISVQKIPEIKITSINVHLPFLLNSFLKWWEGRMERIHCRRLLQQPNLDQQSKVLVEYRWNNSFFLFSSFSRLTRGCYSVFSFCTTECDTHPETTREDSSVLLGHLFLPLGSLSLSSPLSSVDFCCVVVDILYRWNE